MWKHQQSLSFLWQQDPDNTDHDPQAWDLLTVSLKSSSIHSAPLLTHRPPSCHHLCHLSGRPTIRELPEGSFTGEPCHITRFLQNVSAVHVADRTAHPLCRSVCRTPSSVCSSSLVRTLFLKPSPLSPGEPLLLSQAAPSCSLRCPRLTPVLHVTLPPLGQLVCFLPCPTRLSVDRGPREGAASSYSHSISIF